MPRYLFNVRDQHRREQDLEGMELSDLDAVLREALRSRKRRIAACLRSGALLDEALRRAFEIADEAWQVVRPFRSHSREGVLDLLHRHFGLRSAPMTRSISPPSKMQATACSMARPRD
jgi:hypothetical protein